MDGNIMDLAVGIQSAKGTAATTTERFNLAGGATPAPAKVTTDDSRATLTQPVSVQAYAPRIAVAGQPEAFVRPNMIGLLLYAILGAKAVAGASDPFTHTFSIAGTQPWLTFYRAIAGTYYERFVDCKLTYLRLSSAAGRPLRVAFGVAGITPRFRTADPGGATETGLPFLHYDGKAALKVEGSAVATIDQFDLTISRETTATDRLTGPHVRTGARVTVDANVGQVLASFALANRLYYGASSPANDTAGVITPLELGGAPAGLEFKFTRQTGPERSLTLALPRVYVKDLEPVRGSPLRQDVTYGILKPAASSGITATLLNARSAY